MNNNYKKILDAAFKRANSISITESLLYQDGLKERMMPELVDELLNRKHSLGNHPIFPVDDETQFEQKIMGKRFSDVVKRYKNAHDLTDVDEKKLIESSIGLLHSTIELEQLHKKELEELAERMVREEFDMGDDIVEINCELVDKVTLVGTKKNPKPMPSGFEFENHEQMENAKDEVYKRRFINAMIQGSAKKSTHMFNMVEDEIAEMDPLLVNRYRKLMSTADYMYYLVKDMEKMIPGGVVKVQFPNKNREKAIINVQALCFPVLIHELVKGVMELISANGLPKDKIVGEYVINKADFLAAEPWDMRIGPALWERFTDLIPAEDFNIKHHIYTDLISLPVKEFNQKMREIMSGTKEGIKIVKGLADEYKKELKEEEFKDAIGNANDIDEEPQGYNLQDLIGEDSDDEGWDINDLLSNI